MKNQIIVVLFVLLSGFSMGQAFQNRGNYITLGYGLDPWGHPGIGNAFGAYKKTTIGPLVLTYERGITEKLGIGRIGVGGSFAQSWYTQRYNYGNVEDIYRTSRFNVMAKAAYHFDFGIEKMDVYAGLAAGASVYVDKDIIYEPLNSAANSQGYINTSRTYVRPAHYEFIGIRYYFTTAFGVYAEVGYGLAALNGGMVFHF